MFSSGDVLTKHVLRRLPEDSGRMEEMVTATEREAGDRQLGDPRATCENPKEVAVLVE
jgi:hypothetical protein